MDNAIRGYADMQRKAYRTNNNKLSGNSNCCCTDKNNYPLDGNCKISNIIYRAKFESGNSVMYYISQQCKFLRRDLRP